MTLALPVVATTTHDMTSGSLWLGDELLFSTDYLRLFVYSVLMWGFLSAFLNVVVVIVVVVVVENQSDLISRMLHFELRIFERS